VVVAQFATHPSVWFVLPMLGLPWAGYVLLAESWAVSLECLLYRLVFPALSWQRALGVAFLANGASVWVTLLIQ